MAPYFDDNQPYYPLIKARRFSDAVNVGLSWLEQEKQSNPTRYATEPKGTPFYFLGIAAFASHDYQTATFLFDAAVAEDRLYHSSNPDTPALLFMRLDDKQPQQAAFEVVKIVVARLEEARKDYAARKADALSFDQVRDHFLKRVLTQPELRTLTTTFVSFLAERDYRLKMIDLTQPGVSREPFFTHLFRGCLLFESLLKENPARRPTQKTLGQIFKQNSFIRNKLGVPRSIRTSLRDFDAVVRSLKPNQPIANAIECTAQARNTLGHNLVWLTKSLDAKKYDLLATNIAASCLHVISRLYR
jgi:hypothetical protein